MPFQLSPLVTAALKQKTADAALAKQRSSIAGLFAPPGGQTPPNVAAAASPAQSGPDPSSSQGPTPSGSDPSSIGAWAAAPAAQPAPTRPQAQQTAQIAPAQPSNADIGSALAAAIAPGWIEQNAAKSKLTQVLAGNTAAAATAMGTDGSDPRTVAQAQAVLAQHVATALGITAEQAQQYVASAAQTLQAGG